jgi:hypothetical protein
MDRTASSRGRAGATHILPPEPQEAATVEIALVPTPARASRARRRRCWQRRPPRRPPCAPTRPTGHIFPDGAPNMASSQSRPRRRPSAPTSPAYQYSRRPATRAHLTAGRSSAHRRQHAAQRPPIDLCADPYCGAVGQRDLDQTGRSGGWLNLGSQAGCVASVVTSLGATSAWAKRTDARVTASGWHAINACRQV